VQLGPRCLADLWAGGQKTPHQASTEDGRTGAEGTSHLRRRQNSGTNKNRAATLCPLAVSDGLLMTETSGQRGRAYCCDIVASAQSKKATVMSCRQSQVR
jgi:hypothetical protein